jgi:hypothetical protein
MTSINDIYYVVTNADIEVLFHDPLVCVLAVFVMAYVVMRFS